MRPGISHPVDPTVLNLIEESVYHSIQSGNIPQALQLYYGRLGGLSHLSKTIGEYARGARILRSFPECPNRYDLAWYLRGIGDLEGAGRFLLDVYALWAGTLNCLRGLLPRVADDSTSWSATLSVARFLSGRSNGRIEYEYLGWGEAVIVGELHLLRREFGRALGGNVTGVVLPRQCENNCCSLKSKSYQESQQSSCRTRWRNPMDIALWFCRAFMFISSCPCQDLNGRKAV